MILALTFASVAATNPGVCDNAIAACDACMASTDDGGCCNQVWYGDWTPEDENDGCTYWSTRCDTQAETDVLAAKVLTACPTLIAIAPQYRPADEAVKKSVVVPLLN